MKATIFAILFVAVSASAFQQENPGDFERRIVTNQIRRAIEQLRQAIREAGLDPLEIERYDLNVSPIPFVRITAFIDSLVFTGASNIVVNRLAYSVITNRLRFDISLPLLELSIGEAGVNANILLTRHTGQLNGTLAISQVRFSGDVRVRAGLISGISIRSLRINFRVQNIKSAFNLTYQDEDLSDVLNGIFNETIPGLLKTYEATIDQFLSDLVKSIVEQTLNNN